MADLTTANLIAAVSPQRYATGVLTNQTIRVQFFRDIDQSTLSDATVALQIVGTVSRIPVTLSYSNRVLTITPVSGLSPNTSYQLTLVGDSNPQGDVLTNNITGIKDIVGNGMVGVFNTTFTTGGATSPTQVSLVSPVDQASILMQPTFSWAPATGAATYEIQVSKSNTFEQIYWPNGEVWNSALTQVTPHLAFDLNQGYWWRVRALASNGTPGDWSAAATFYYGDPTLGQVTPDDAPLGNIGTTQQPLQILSTSPAPGTANLQKTQYPAQITIVLSGPIDPSTLQPGCVRIDALAIDGTTFDSNNFTPIWSPALNGDEYGSGGITMEQPVDQYQRIYVSGSLTNLMPKSSFDGTNTTLSVDIPGDYWQQNNVYTVTIDLPQLRQPVNFSFTSAYAPVFCGVREVRSETDHFAPQFTDDEILMHIRDNSLEALRIQVYPPTQIDGQRWIYSPPVSFNVNNPPYFVRKYVKLSTAKDLLEHHFMSLIGQGSTMLGDFQVNRELAALKSNIQAAIAQLDAEIMPYLDQLHGLTNRGYARGEWAQRAERSHVNPVWGYPFGSRPRGTTF